MADLMLNAFDLSPEFLVGLVGRFVRATVDAEERTIIGRVSDADGFTVTVGETYRGLVSSVTVTADNRVRLTLRWVEDVRDA